MIPAGTYAATVIPVETPHGKVSIQFGPGTANSPFTGVVTFEILNGPCAGQTISAFLYFGDKSVEISMKALRACGFAGDDIDKFSDQNPDIECQIVVEHETYQGKTRAKVKWINVPNRGFVLSEQLDPSALRKYAAQMKSSMRAIPSVAGKKAERQAPSAAAAASEDRGDDPALDGQRGFSRSFSQQDPSPPASDDDIPF